MSPQWIPQNIQKRLLLYVLQQLSLFSEIDLPNLEEVSLNNITLKDVQMDPEKVGKKAGFNLRYGLVKLFEMNGGVMGGVNIDIKGMELVIAPDINTQSLTEVQFSLAQSTANLANTVMFDKEEDSENSDLSSSEDKDKPSALSGMMAKAVEIALSRLHINIGDLKIKVVSELLDLQINVENLKLETSNGVRNVQIQGLSVSTLKPIVEPGTKEEQLKENNGNSSNRDESDSDSDESTSSEDGYGDESLMDSMVFSREEANSIYMSATSQSFKKEEEIPPVIFTIDTLSVSFEGLHSISNLEIEVGELVIASIPLFPTVCTTLTSISRAIKFKGYQKRKPKSSSNNTSKFPQYDANDIDVSETSESPNENLPFFNHLNINNIVISLNSAISKSGSLCNSVSNTKIVIGDFYLHQKSDKLIYGGIKELSIVHISSRKKTIILAFENTENNLGSNNVKDEAAFKNDLRFELFVNERGHQEFTLLCSKPLNVHIYYKHLTELINFKNSFIVLLENIKHLQQTYANYEAANNSKPKPTKEETNFNTILQTSLISLNIHLDDQCLKLMVYPISFKSVENQLIIPKVLIKYCNQNENEITLTTIPNIRLITKPKEFKSFSFDTGGTQPKSLTFISSLILTIPELTVKIEKVDLQNIIQGFKGFISNMRNIQNDPHITTFKNSGHLKNVSNSSGSLRTSQRFRRPAVKLTVTSKVLFRAIINKTTIEVDNISPDFGNVFILLDKISTDCLQDGALQGAIQSIRINRITKNINESFLKKLKYSTDDKTPMLLFSHKTKEDNSHLLVFLKNHQIEYYANWLKLFENISSNGNKSVPINNYPHSCNSPTYGEKKNSKFEIKFTIVDLVLGLTPSRLPSKAFLTFDLSTADVSIGGFQSYVKSSLRGGYLFVIDDVKNVSQNSKRPSTSPRSWLINSGYLQFSNINSIHVGVTVHENEKELRQGPPKQNNKDQAALIEVKVHMDEQRIDLCADSAHVLIQFLNDIKPPIFVPDEQKFKVNINNDINVFDEISDLFDTKVEQSKAPIFIETGESEFIEEYYANSGSNSTSSLMNSLNLNGPNADYSLSIEENHFAQQKYNEDENIIPVSLYVNISKTNLYLYDGYDWKSTRNGIKNAVERVEARAYEELQERQNIENSFDFETNSFEGQGIIEEMVYQSIYVTIPQGENPSTLTGKVNKDIENNGNLDNSNITESQNLLIKRSKSHKVSLEIKNLELKVQIFSTRNPVLEPSESESFELLNSVRINVEDFQVLDNIPTSTWHQLVGYMRSAGERELSASAIKIELTNVRPDPNLFANEAILDICIIPLRFYIDQDTLDFLIRFFEFRDCRFNLPIDDILYIEKFKINSVPIKVDYKPKQINYTGIQSGQAAELVNFFILDGAEVVLRGVTLYGQLGFPNLGKSLGKVWGPDIQKTQLPGILSGLSPFRSIVNIGNGVSQLVTVPLKEYKKDKRLIRGLQKGASKFAKSTSAELLKLGVKLAAGTQGLLEQSEEVFGGEGSNARRPKYQTALLKNSTIDQEFYDEDVTSKLKKQERDLMEASQLLNDQSQKLLNNVRFVENSKFYGINQLNTSDLTHNNKHDNVIEEEEIDSSEEEDYEKQKLISLYSNQPSSAQQGFLQAYGSIGKNYRYTKDAIIKTRDAMMDAETISKAAASVAKTAPVIIIRPMIGATEAVQKTLLGITNQIDPQMKLDSEDKYRPQE